MQRRILFNSQFFWESCLKTNQLLQPQRNVQEGRLSLEGERQLREEAGGFADIGLDPPPHLVEVRMFGGSGQWEGLEEGGPENTKGNMFGAPPTHAITAEVYSSGKQFFWEP